MKQDNKVKLLILGESSVGKTALLNRFAKNEFVATSTSTGMHFIIAFQVDFVNKQITGMDYAIKMIEIDKKKVQLSVWDTAGQERFRSITFNLYKDSQGIFLVFDLTNAKTFQTLEAWMKLIKDNINEGFQVALIGTKCDLKDQIVIDKEMINLFLDKYDFQYDYFETSSVDNINVTESFVSLATKVYRSNQKHYQSLMAQGIDSGDNTNSVLRNVDREEKKKSKCCD